jgi:PHD/YefM family antitoxin component YafN of YafNO toxin-antitoxin module
MDLRRTERELADNLPLLMERVCSENDRVLVTRGRDAVAALVSMEDLSFLQNYASLLEDRLAAGGSQSTE